MGKLQKISCSSGTDSLQSMLSCPQHMPPTRYCRPGKVFDLGINKEKKKPCDVWPLCLVVSTQAGSHEVMEAQLMSHQWPHLAHCIGQGARQGASPKTQQGFPGQREHWRERGGGKWAESVQCPDLSCCWGLLSDLEVGDVALCSQRVGRGGRMDSGREDSGRIWNAVLISRCL